MPKIPDVTALGGRPTPRVTRGVGNVTAVGRGVQQAANIAASSANRAAQGTDALAQGLGQAGQAVERLQLREEGLARDSDDTAFAELLSKFHRNLEATADLSEKEVIAEARKHAIELRDQFLSNHKGSGQSRAMLGNRLERRRVQFADTLTVQHITASDARQKNSFEKRNRGITAQILEDPDVLLNPDIGAVFRKHDGTLEDDIEFLNPSPIKKRAFREIGRENIVQSMITPLIREGDFGRARTLLTHPEIKEVLDPGVRRKFAARIGSAERELGKARREGRAVLELAATILGPNATEEQIRSAAGQLAGISESQNLEFFNMGGEMGLIGIDKNTGAIVTRVPGPSIEQQAEKAGAIEGAKLIAKATVMGQVLGNLGVEPLPTVDDENGNQVEGPAITQPFGPQEETSEDAQEVARLLVGSRRLLVGGFVSEANAWIAQARVLIENSTDIQRQRELDKPISSDLASELGVEIGTTLRGVRGILPPSPGKLAEERGAGGARGKERIAGEEQLSFIDEARTMVGDLLDEVETDPGVVGVRGSLRATGQTAISVLGDLGFDSLTETARDMAFENTELGLDSITSMFDSPTLSVLDIMENSIGLILARLRQPTGRLTVDVIKRSIDDVQLKGLKGSAQIQNRLKFVLDQLDRRAGAIQRRFNLPEEESEPSNLQRFRIEGDQIVPVGP